MPEPSKPTGARPRVLVLQHPREAGHWLGTVSLLEKQLPGVVVRVGLSWPNLRRALGVEEAAPGEWAVLRAGTREEKKRADWVRAGAAASRVAFLDKKGQCLADDAAARRAIKGIVLLDGNWKQAKTLWWRNAWLLKLRRAVVFPDRPSLYGDLRREPRREFVSTYEAAAMALDDLGLLDRPFEGLMVALAAHLDALR